jgi:hypothetical protein
MFASTMTSCIRYVLVLTRITSSTEKWDNQVPDREKQRQKAGNPQAKERMSHRCPIYVPYMSHILKIWDIYGASMKHVWSNHYFTLEKLTSAYGMTVGEKNGEAGADNIEISIHRN